MENFENGQIEEIVEENLDAEESAEKNADEISELYARIDELESSLTAEKIKVAMLLSGVIGEKLDEAAALAEGLLKTGKSADEAVSEIISAYPHLKAVKRDIPRFASAGTGSSDGFSAIRRIFSGK